MSRTSNQRNDGLEGPSYREMRLLEEVEASPELSQRNLAYRLRIALGLANLLVRNLVNKGYIRVTRIGWKRWVYILTPAGVARKAHLTLAYVNRFLDHYHRVRTLVREDLQSLTMNAESRIAIYGTTELAELLYLSLRDMGVSEIEVFDATERTDDFLGMRVRSLESIVPTDYVKVMVAYSEEVEARRQELCDRGVPASQIVTLLQDPAQQAGAVDTSAASD